MNVKTNYQNEKALSSGAPASAVAPAPAEAQAGVPARLPAGSRGGVPAAASSAAATAAVFGGGQSAPVSPPAAQRRAAKVKAPAPSVDEVLEFLLNESNQYVSQKNETAAAILDNRGNSPRKPRRAPVRYRKDECEREDEEARELAIAIEIENKKIRQEAARAADIARYPAEKKATITNFYNALESNAETLRRAAQDRAGRELLREKADIDVRHEVLRGLQKAIDNGYLTQNNMRALAGCGRRAIPHENNEENIDSDVSIHAYAENGLYKYSLVGLQHCSSPLRCPVCSAKISYVRREQVRKAVSTMIDKEACVPFFLTLTAPHSKDTDIVDFVSRFRDAKTAFGKSTVWKKFCNAVDFQAQIVASELTVDAPWSSLKTGPHFHAHSVLFIRYSLDAECIDIIQKELAAAWSEACERVGLVTVEKVSAHRLHGVHFEAARSIDCAVDYLIKEVSFEISPPPLTKSGRREGDRLSQWQFMRLATTTHPELLPDLNEIMLALRGVRALFWSPGLKKRCNIEAISDKKIAEQPEREDHDEHDSRPEAAENMVIMKGEEAFKIIDIPRSDWGFVCRYGAQRLLVKSLEYISKGALIEEEEAKKILEKIVNGINPLTGETLRPLMSLHYSYKEYRAATFVPPVAAAA